MGILFTNNAQSTLPSGITGLPTPATTIFVQSTDAATFPQPVNPGDYFMVTLEDKTQNPVLREIVKCTARVGNQLTVVRAQEGTVASAFNAGVTVAHRITAGSIATIQAGTTQVVQLYLGSYSAAPTTTLQNTSLVAGNMYYDTTLNGLYEYTGVLWTPVASTTQTLALGIYLGSFSSPPITMLGGGSLVVGTLYYNTAVPALYVYYGGAWQLASTQTVAAPVAASSGNVITGNQTVTGNENVGGNISCTNITVSNETSTEVLILAGQTVVAAGDVSGTPFSQNFPAGTIMQWGTGSTNGSGVATISFSSAYGSVLGTLQVTLGNVGVNCTVRITGQSLTGFTILVENTNNTGGVSAPFNWFAVGI